MLALHRRLLAPRRAESSLAVGSYEPVETAGDVLAYAREKDGSRFLIVLNLGHEPTTFDPGGHGALGRIVLTTHLDREGEQATGALELRSGEGVILEKSVLQRPPAK
jgi:alpha-glucosidase